MNSSLSIEQALESFLTGVLCIDGNERVPLLKASGRILAEDIAAPFSVPSFPKSAMDGYAVRAGETAAASEKTPAVLKVIGQRLAGETTAIPEAPMR